MNICKGHIYIIFCHINPKIYYVGSTFNQLKQRWNRHKHHYKEKQPVSLYKYFDEYGIENFSIKLIKSYNVYREHNRDNQHLKAYEQLWINKFRNSCNLYHSFNPLSKLRDKENKKKWRENNKNKNKILKHSRDYKKNNKEKILEKAKEKYTCECGSILTIVKKSRHLKSKKHQDYIKNNINNI